MRLIAFTNPVGDAVWINRDQIVAVRDALEAVDGSAKTVIVTQAGHYGVIETVAHVLQKIQE